MGERCLTSVFLSPIYKNTKDNNIKSEYGSYNDPFHRHLLQDLPLQCVILAFNALLDGE